MYKLIILCVVIAMCHGCHYSCLNCTGPEYISCLNCSSGGSLTIVQNTAVTPNQYWSSVYSTGTCVSTMADAANALGAVIFILVVGLSLFLQTKQCFYLLLTLQTYGLYNLVEMAWVNPIGYVLQGLQYFMIFNTINSGSKTEDYLLVASKNYRLHSFLGTTNLLQNLIIIVPITLVAVALLVVLAVVVGRSKKQLPKKKGPAVLSEKGQTFLEGKDLQAEQSGRDVEQPQEGRCEACRRWFSRQILQKIVRFLLCLLFLMAQQTCVVLLVSLVYQSPTNTTTIALCIIYLHILLFVMGYCYYYRVEYFKEKRLMYLTFAQKIILPVMVVVPIKYQYVFFIFAGCFLVLQFVFDWINGLYNQFNRIIIYKVCQFVCVIVLTVYYIVQDTLDSYSRSRTAAIAATFVLALNLLCFFGVELPFAIKDKYFSGGQPPMEEVKDAKEMNDMVELVQNDTVNQINDGNGVADNKMVLMVENMDDYEVQDSEDGDQNLNEAKKDEATLDGNSVAAELRKPVVVEEVRVKSVIKDQEEPKVEPVQPTKPKKRRRQIIDPALRLRYGI